MGSRLLTTLLFCYVVGCFVHGSGEAGTCHSTLSAIREMLDGRTELPETCENCQGRPGKRGGVGPRGPFGPKGVEGRPGACECDLSAVEELAAKIAELQQFNAKMIGQMRENHADSPGACYAGVSTGKIPLSDISASSIYPHSHCVLQNVALNSARAWCAATSDVHQWIQVDQRTPRPVTGVLTQGRKDCCNQFVRTYQISYGDDLDDMTFYQEDGHPKIFTGNSEPLAAVVNVFSQSITARYFRIHPVTYNKHISMRIELLTC